MLYVYPKTNKQKSYEDHYITKKNTLELSILTLIILTPINYFYQNNILKFQDIKCEQMKLVFQFINKDLSNELTALYIFNHEISKYEIYM